MVYKPIYICRT